MKEVIDRLFVANEIFRNDDVVDTSGFMQKIFFCQSAIFQTKFTCSKLWCYIFFFKHLTDLEDVMAIHLTDYHHAKSRIPQ